jgi:hypothetical protein
MFMYFFSQAGHMLKKIKMELQAQLLFNFCVLKIFFKKVKNLFV